MSPTQLPAAAALSLTMAGAACAQNNSLYFNFPNGNVYDGSTPVKVEVWAGFEPQYFAWASWKADLNGEASGSFSNISQGLPWTLPGSSAGTAAGGSVTGIATGQLWFSPLFFPDSSNPILIWSGEWSTKDPTPRSLALSTLTAKYYVYLPNQTSEFVVPSEASGLIQVVPVPATLLGALSLVCLGRRKR